MRDLRRYARQTNMRLVFGGMLITFVVGLGLIYVFYGLGAALLGFVCLLGGFAPLLLIALVLWGLDWVVKRKEE